MLEIVGSQTPYTDKRERPRKKYINLRYRSGGKPPKITQRSKSAAQIRETNSPYLDGSFSLSTSNQLTGLFDSSLSPEDLKIMKSFSGNPRHSLDLNLDINPENRVNQNSFYLENSDIISRTRDHEITSLQPTLRQSYAVASRSQTNDPKITRSLALTEGMRDVNSEQEWAKLGDQSEDVRCINHQMKLAKEKLDKLRIEEAELIRKLEAKLESQTTLPKWYELKNADFCIQARRNNKMLKRERTVDKQNAMALSLEF